LAVWVGVYWPDLTGFDEYLWFCLVAGVRQRSGVSPPGSSAALEPRHPGGAGPWPVWPRSARP